MINSIMGAHSSKLDQLLHDIENLHPKRIDLSLSRMERLLHKLGDPHHKLAPVIHIGGTNGKGSTLSFIRTMLQAHNINVSCYTSPHLVHFHERIIINNTYINDDDLYDILQHIVTINNQEPITFFELTTIAAFMAFSYHTSDVILLEVGMGGRLDSTNIIPEKFISIITPIAKDHTDFLGNSYAAIAKEKAGIIPNSTYNIIAKQRANVTTILKEHARQHNVTLYEQGHDFNFKTYKKYWTWCGQHHHYDNINYPALYGDFQLQNATIALQALELVAPLLSINISQKTINTAMQHITWPARLQPIKHLPIIRQHAPNLNHVWLDGCHNSHGAKHVANFIKKHHQNEPLTIIIALMGNRPINDFIKYFIALNPYIIACDLPQEHAGHAKEIIRDTCINKYQLQAISAPSVDHALHISAARGHNSFIIGSLYQAGYVLGYQ